MHCAWQNAALSRGGCMLNGFFCEASAATTQIAPVSALGSPLSHGRGT